MRSAFRRAAIPILALLLSACDGGGPEPASVVLYSSIDDTYTRQITRAFEQETGIRVKVVTDSEAAKSTGLLQRLLAEKERPVADVFWSGDVMRALKLRAAGISDPLADAGGEIPGFDRAWGIGTGPGRLRMIAFNSRLLKPGQVPQRVEDLATPGVANRCCLANPLFGSTLMHAAMLLQLWGREKAEKFFRDFAANGGRVLASNGEVKRRVSDGEFAFGLTDSDDVAVAIGDGKDLGYRLPDQGEGDSGAVLIPSAAVLVRGAPHRDSGERLAHFLGRADMQRMLRDGEAAFFPLLPGGAEKIAKVWSFDFAEIKLAPRMNEQTIAIFETWAGSFLETWVQDRQR